MSKHVVSWMVCGAFAAGAGMVAGSAWAQANYPVPGKPIRMVLPFPPGAPSDIIGRAISVEMSKQLRVPVVADNRPGVGGNLGLAELSKLPADGYNIVITTPAIALGPSLYKNPGYDAQKDLTPIARLAGIENVMLVHPNVPAKTLPEFIALARKEPGKLNYGSGGAGTTNHLANELLKSLANIDIVHVPYKGATVAVVSLMGGEVDEVIVSVASSLPYIRTGKVRPIAVLSAKRVAPLPDVPTAVESGVKDFLMSIWYGMLGPGHMSPELVNRLNQEAVRALSAPEVRKSFAVQGVDPWPSTPAEFDQLIRSETARYAKIIEKAGLKKE